MGAKRIQPERPPIETQHAMAAAMGMSKSAARDRLLEFGFPTRGPWPAWVPDTLQGLEDRVAEIARRNTPKGADGDDLLFAGEGTSPNLERYRAARATLAEMEVAERERVTLRLDALKTWLSDAARVLKDAGERMRVKWPDAHELLIEALDELDRTASKGPEANDGGGDAENG